MEKININNLLVVILFIATAPFLGAQATVDFTIKSGALIEIVYINAEGSNYSISDLDKLAKSYQRQGGEVLAKFETTNFPEVANVVFTHRKYSYILLVQWIDPAARTQERSSEILAHTERKVGKEKLQFGFFASQEETPVSLNPEKAYDFTSAWLISDDPCAAPALMEVIGGYFGKIGPALLKYEISNPAFLGPHPEMPRYESRIFVPHMLGIFEWRDFSDRAKFTQDPLYEPHVDVRNSVLKQIDVSFNKLIQ